MSVFAVGSQRRFGVARKERLYMEAQSRVVTYEVMRLAPWPDCCSVVMIGSKSCFARRFLGAPPFEVALPAACLALMVAAFLISEPFMAAACSEAPEMQIEHQEPGSR